MKKQRMQADNVEQLMEIVRALQNGEEPDIEKIKAKDRAERARRAEEARQAQIAARKAREARKRAAQEAAEKEAERQREEAQGGTQEKADAAGSRIAGEQASSDAKPKHRSLGGPSWLRETDADTAKEKQPEKKQEKGTAKAREVEVPEFPDPVPPYFDEESEEEFLRFLEEEETASLPPVLTLAASAVSKAAGWAGGLIGQARKNIAARRPAGPDNKSNRKKPASARKTEKEELPDLKPEEEEILPRSGRGKEDALPHSRREKEDVLPRSGRGKTGESLHTDFEPDEEEELLRSLSAREKSGSEKAEPVSGDPEEKPAAPELPPDVLSFLDDEDDEPLPEFGTKKDREKGAGSGDTSSSAEEEEPDLEEEPEETRKSGASKPRVGNRFLQLLRRPAGKKARKMPDSMDDLDDEEEAEDEDDLLIEDVNVPMRAGAADRKPRPERDLPESEDLPDNEKRQEPENRGENEDLPENEDSLNNAEGPGKDTDPSKDETSRKEKAAGEDADPSKAESLRNEGPAGKDADRSKAEGSQKEEIPEEDENLSEDTGSREKDKGKDTDPEEDALTEKKSRAKGSVRETGRRASRTSADRRNTSGKAARSKKKPPQVPVWVLPVLLAVAVVVAGVLLVRFVGNVLTENAKKKNVKSEDGLVISVESQPSEWVNYAQITMKLHGDAAQASSVNVNGTACDVTEGGFFTVEASQPVLQVSVNVEDTVQHAQVTIPKIDSSAPSVTATRDEEKGQVQLKAEDDASGADIIYYHIGDADTEPQLTDYLEYKEPIAWEDGKVYRYYARDRAGNRTAPVASTLEDPDSISLNQQSFALFPGDTVQLEISIEPALALLRNLTYTSSDPDVASVDANGLLTAGVEGNAEITVRAEGVSDIFCNVVVDASRTVTITGLGDCTLGTYPSVNAAASFDAYAQMYGYTWFFDKVREFLEQDDATFANLEGPLTTAEGSADKQFVFKGSPEYTQILTDGSVEVVTLANNHSEDYGEQGLNDTKAALDGAGIPYCIGDTVAYLDLNHVKTAFIGIYEPSLDASYEERTRNCIARAKEDGAQLIIVAFHWGGELVYEPVDIQKEVGHLAIDLGADLVIGHHPHVVNGIEQYNGHYIVYSVGNFCFGGSTSPTDPDAMIVQQSFTVSETGTQPGELKVLPIRTSSDYSINNYQPMILEGDEALRVMNKINQYCAPFGTKF